MQLPNMPSTQRDWAHTEPDSFCELTTLYNFPPLNDNFIFLGTTAFIKANKSCSVGFSSFDASLYYILYF